LRGGRQSPKGAVPSNEAIHSLIRFARQPHAKCFTFHTLIAIMNKKQEENMAMLQVRDIDNRLYNDIKHRANIKRRSLSQEVISILEKYLANPDSFALNQTKDFLNLTFEDARRADKIIGDIRKRRKNRKLFGAANGISD
jgi:plasmid stability protein